MTRTATCVPMRTGKATAATAMAATRTTPGAGTVGMAAVPRVMEILLGTIGMEMATTERRKREE